MGGQVSLAQRVAGEEGFKGKTGVNALVAFLHSDQRALSTMVASAGVAKVPVPWRRAVGEEEGAVRRQARAARDEGAGRHASCAGRWRACLTRCGKSWGGKGSAVGLGRSEEESTNRRWQQALGRRVKRLPAVPSRAQSQRLVLLSRRLRDRCCKRRLRDSGSGTLRRHARLPQRRMPHVWCSEWRASGGYARCGKAVSNVVLPAAQEGRMLAGWALRLGLD